MQKNMKNELQKLTQAELVNQAAEIKKALFMLRMKKVSNPEKNTALPRILRRSLACTLTFLRQKELHGSR